MQRIKFLIIFVFIFVFYTAKINANSSLKNNILKLISSKNADIGISIIGFEDPINLNINNNIHFPMQSIFKFHLALTVLHKIDAGNFTLNKKIYITKKELLSNTWSPIKQKYPEGNISLELSEIISLTVSQSDNIGCDILLKLIGGPKVVNDYIHEIGIKEVDIKVNEEEMHKDWKAQFKNWTTPEASSILLKKFYTQKILSKNSFEFLCKVMLNTKTGGNRIKGKLPANTKVLHKTGTSGKNKDGIIEVINDIGIIYLPNKKHYAISVFIFNSKEKFFENEKIISDISKATWDFFNNI